MPKALVVILTAPTRGSGIKVELPVETVDTIDKQAPVTKAFMDAGARYVNVTPSRTVARGHAQATKDQAAALALQGLDSLGYQPDDVDTRMQSITDDEYTALFS